MVIAMGRPAMTRMTIALAGDDDDDEDADNDYSDDRMAMTNSHVRAYQANRISQMDDHVTMPIV